MHKRMEKSVEEYLSNKKAYFMVREDLKRLQQYCVLYKNELFKFNKDIMGKTIYSTSNFAQKKQSMPAQQSSSLTAEDILDQPISKSAEYFQPEEKWEVDKFDHFIMKCSRKDQYEKEAQVYFCYGRISNRMMLMRYGMTLEYNKYDHLYLRVHYLPKLLAKGVAPRLLRNISTDYRISKYKRFKLKYTQFPIDLVLFARAVLWTYNVHSLDSLFTIQDLNLEYDALSLVLDLLKDFETTHFNQSIAEDEALLQDDKQNYHQHFATIYRLERHRILQHQIKYSLLFLIP